MKSKKNIPIHNFSIDNETSEAFKIITLEGSNAYDTLVPHRHNYYEIFLFNKGGGNHIIDFETIPIEDNSIHFVSPGQVHKVDRGTDSNGHLIIFSREFYYGNSTNKKSLFDVPFFNNNFSTPIINLSDVDFSKILSFFISMKTEYNTNNEGKNEMIQSYLNLLILNCKRLFVNKKTQKNVNHKVLQDFRRLLENEFEQTHHVSYYAEKLNINSKKLSLITKKEVGKSALELIHARIILEAKRLLRYSNHSIKEISFFLNFEDPSHFGKFFKSKVGITPKEYRVTN
jgi:AraC family transcriptional activator of pobA